MIQYRILQTKHAYYEKLNMIVYDENLDQNFQYLVGHLFEVISYFHFIFLRCFIAGLRQGVEFWSRFKIGLE